jgi:DNA-binding NtrC family response regulator
MSETILLLGGEKATRSKVARQLEARRYTVRALRFDDGEMSRSLDGQVAAVIVLLPTDAGRGEDLLPKLARSSAPPTIVIGSDDSVPDGATAYRLGAQDYVASLDDRGRLYEALGLLLGTSRRDSELRYFRDRAAQSTDWSAVVGKCEAMRSALAVVQQILTRSSLRSMPPILITGETGTGKGLVARSIHFNSSRRHEPYVDVNCAAIPASLIEAELLGHERGAFTDARTARAGLFETADGGTLFLDEIAALPIELQAKLLTVTEEKRVRRIGGRESKKVDVQIIAATHRNLAEMVDRSLFREDLFHRLNVIGVQLPPLRDRGEDKAHLAERFVEQMCNQYGLPTRDITPEAKQLIVDYDWPGNVRELKNQIEQIILVADDYEIRPEHFKFVRRKKSSRVGLRSNGGELEIELPEDGVSLDAVERSIIKKALDLCDGNVSRTARFLSISRQTLVYRLKKHDIANTG